MYSKSLTLNETGDKITVLTFDEFGRPETLKIISSRGGLSLVWLNYGETQELIKFLREHVTNKL